MDIINLYSDINFVIDLDKVKIHWSYVGKVSR